MRRVLSPTELLRPELLIVLRPGVLLNERSGKKRDHHLVMTDERISLAGAARGGTVDDVRQRPVLALEVDVNGGQSTERDAVIAGDRDRLEKDLGKDHRRPAIEVNPLLEAGDITDEIPEIAE